MQPGPDTLRPSSTDEHYVVFRRNPDHCEVIRIRAASLREAIALYAAQKYHSDTAVGPLWAPDGFGGGHTYEHPLAFIESEVRVYSGWEIRRDIPAHDPRPYHVILVSQDPFTDADAIAWCRRMLGRTHRRRARAFVWYLKGGALVTYYLRRRQERPIHIVGRFFVPWNDWDQAYRWEGSYDDILDQLVV